MSAALGFCVACFLQPTIGQKDAAFTNLSEMLFVKGSKPFMG